MRRPSAIVIQSVIQLVNRRFGTILLIAIASIASGCYLDEPLVHKSQLPLDPALIGTWEDKDKAKWNVSRHSETEYAIRDSKGEPMIAFPGRLGNKSFIQITVPQSGGKLIYVVISYAVSGDTLEISMLDPKPATATPIGFAEIKNAFLQNLNPDKFFAKIGTFKKINAASETAKSPPAPRPTKVAAKPAPSFIARSTQMRNNSPSSARTSASVRSTSKSTPKLEEALRSAAKAGNIEALREALAKGANINAKDDKGSTPLILAAFKGERAAVEELLAKGANVNAKDSDGETALMRAAFWGRYFIVKALLEAGGDVFETDKQGDTALTYAEMGLEMDQEINEGEFEELFEEIIEMLKARMGNRRPMNFLEAAAKGNIQVVRSLIAKGANVNVSNDDETTALMFAAGNGNTAVVQLLLSKGANVDSQNTSGNTALMAAVYAKSLPIVQLLLANKADVHAKDDNGYTALMWAAIKGDAPIVKFLLSKGSDVHAKDNDGDTALDLATVKKHIEVIQILTARMNRRTTTNPIASKPVARSPVSQPVCNDYLFRVNAFLQTGIVIKRGDRLTFSASGTVSFGAFAGSGGPQGINGFRGYNLAAGDFQHGLLIGRIDRNQGYFAIGTGGVMESANVDGVLDLNVNDADTSNNGGYFEVKINICKAK